MTKSNKPEALYRDLRFSTPADFNAWLKDKTEYVVEFEDHGQDFLHWWIDDRGEVLHSDLQSSVWNGSMVDLDSLVVGAELVIINRWGERATVNYPVAGLEEERTA